MSDGSIAVVEAGGLDQTVKTTLAKIAEAEREGNQIAKALTLAGGMQAVREQLTPDMMGAVVKLMNTQLGFRTDKDPANKDRNGHTNTPYPVEVVRDVVIEAMLDGARLVGNEFNIIAGRYYRTLEQFERRIREYPGLQNFKLHIGVPHVKGEGALVDMRAEWVLDGVKSSLDCRQTTDSDTRVPVRVNRGMGLDAVIGKAKRKFLARVLDQLNGTAFEADDPATPAVEPRLATPERPKVEADGEPLDALDHLKRSAIAAIEGYKQESSIDDAVKRFNDRANKLPGYEFEAIDAAFVDVKNAAERRRVLVCAGKTGE